MSSSIVTDVIFFIVEFGIARFLCAMRVFDVRASCSSPRLPFFAKFRFFAASIAELAHGEKSRKLTQSITHSVTRPAYLMRWEPKLFVRNY